MAPPALRWPAHRGRALGQRGRAGADRRAQHGVRPVRAPRPQTTARLLVQPVRGQHQVGWATDRRGRGRRHAGFGRRVSLRGRVRPGGPHRRRGRRQLAQVAGVLPEDDRRGRTVSAQSKCCRRAHRAKAGAGRLPAAWLRYPQPRRRSDRSRSEFARASGRRGGRRARAPRTTAPVTAQPRTDVPCADEQQRRTIMTQASADQWELFAQILDPANRPNPYPLYARLRETPVAVLADGFFAVSSYADIAALLHDPRLSKDQRKTEIPLTGAQRIEPRPFLFLDPPEHDRLRRLVMHQFTPARVNALHDRIVALVDELLDAHRGQSRLDVVDDLAYPLPVTVICELLGVPREDESSFHTWADTLAHSLDPDPGQKTDQGAFQAGMELRNYMQKLVAERRAHPRDDHLS